MSVSTSDLIRVIEAYWSLHGANARGLNPAADKRRAAVGDLHEACVKFQADFAEASEARYANRTQDAEAFSQAFAAQLQAGHYRERFAWHLVKRAKGAGLYLNAGQRAVVTDAMRRAEDGEAIPEAAPAMAESPGRGRRPLLDTDRRRRIGSQVVALLWWYYRRQRTIYKRRSSLRKQPRAQEQAIEAAALALTELTGEAIGKDAVAGWWKAHRVDLALLTKLPKGPSS